MRVKEISRATGRSIGEVANLIITRPEIVPLLEKAKTATEMEAALQYRETPEADLQAPEE